MKKVIMTAVILMAMAISSNAFAQGQTCMFDSECAYDEYCHVPSGYNANPPYGICVRQ